MDKETTRIIRLKIENLFEVYGKDEVLEIFYEFYNEEGSFESE